MVVAVWLAFIVRGAFYCVQQPMWEGYDEWAHFAYIQHIADRGTVPASTDPVSTEVQQSLMLVPLSQSAAMVADGTITHGAFWQLTPGERLRREQELRQLSSNTMPTVPATKAPNGYEAQQPPLYYLLLTLPYLAVKSLSLPAQVLLLRLFSLVVVSTVVFLSYAVACRVFRGEQLSFLVPVLIACLPGLFINVCRVGNESLSIVLISAVILLSLRVLRSDARIRDWAIWGGLLGAALLTKAYALAFLPLLPLVAGLRIRKNSSTVRATVLGCLLACGLVALIAGWWYWRSWITTGTLSGEQLDVASARFTLMEKVRAISMLGWCTVIDSAAFSHIWVGGWSFLVVRSWMYRVFEIAAVLAIVGILVTAARTVRHAIRTGVLGLSGDRLVILVSTYTLACLALAYHSLVTFLVTQTSTALGWYLYSVVVAEVILVASGMSALFGGPWARRGLAVLCVVAAALDLYTVHFISTPYYSGLVAHQGSGALSTFRIQMLSNLGGIEEIFHRLSLNETDCLGPSVVSISWAAYLCATAALIAIALILSRSRR
ncbi:MAG TPA: hypothetical protein VN442_21545 [Bryobacteraceae bacterium]|nr:hypothetical protein [Bryobacteraceae bacterium]